MSRSKEKQKYWVLGACAGVLVLAGGLCAILLSGKGTKIAETVPSSAVATPSAVASMPETNIVVGTPEVDRVAEQQRQEIEAIVIRNNMLPGTTIYGVDVGGLSREEALAAVEDKLSREPLVVNLLLSDGTNVYPASGENIQTLPEEEEDDDAVDPAMKAAEAAGVQGEGEIEDADDTLPIGIRLRFNVEEAVNLAFSLMRDGSLPYETFMAQVRQIAAGQETAPAPEYDTDSVTRFVEYLAGLLDRPAVNASIKMENNQIVYTDGTNGSGIDRDALIDAIMNTDPLSGETLSIPIHDLEPTITKEMLQGRYTRRGYYKTSFSGSTSNRKYNIRFGAEKINGTILKPGDVFSTNETLGKRTRANGWKNAGAYEGGEVVEQPGGGVCQLSSTLYNAVLYADLKVVERRNHSMPVSYIEKGRDATINSVGNIIDFKFENSTSSDIIIMAYTEGNNLYMEIYGVSIDSETDEYDHIEIRTKQTGSTAIKTEYDYDDTKPASYEKTTSKGSKGYTVKTYKDYYKGNTRVKTEDLGVSTYKMFPKKVTKGTMEESKPTAKPTDTGGGTGSDTGSDNDSGSTGSDSGSGSGGSGSDSGSGSGSGSSSDSGSGTGSSGGSGGSGSDSGSGSGGSGSDSGSGTGSSGGSGGSGSDSGSGSGGSGSDSGSGSGSSGSDSGSGSGSSGGSGSDGGSGSGSSGGSGSDGGSGSGSSGGSGSDGGSGSGND